ncbi:MAG: hypothetical protein ABI478_14120, partial [Propionivibrio sp.]
WRDPWMALLGTKKHTQDASRPSPTLRLPALTLKFAGLVAGSAATVACGSLFALHRGISNPACQPIGHDAI